MYSGFAIAGAVDSFVNSRRPYTIGGGSRHSTGRSSLKDSVSEAGRKYFQENTLPFHNSLVLSRSLSLIVIECFLQARDHLPFFQPFTLDIEFLLFKIMEDTAGKPQEIYMENKNSVMQLGEMYNISDAAQRAIAAHPMRSPGFRRKFTIRNLGKAGLFVTRQFINDLVKKRVWINCSSLNVNNVYDASLLCGYVLKLHDMNLLKKSAVVTSSLANIRRILTLAPEVISHEETTGNTGGLVHKSK